MKALVFSLALAVLGAVGAQAGDLNKIDTRGTVTRVQVKRSGPNVTDPVLWSALVIYDAAYGTPRLLTARCSMAFQTFCADLTATGPLKCSAQFTSSFEDPAHAGQWISTTVCSIDGEHGSCLEIGGRLDQDEDGRTIPLAVGIQTGTACSTF